MEEKTMTKGQKIFLSEEVTEKMELIRKNVEFCEQKGIPEAIRAGGRFRQSFEKIVNDTVDLELNSLTEELRTALPFSHKQEEMKCALISKCTEGIREKLFSLTEQQEKEAIIDEMNACKKRYSDFYIRYQLAKISSKN